MDSTNNTYNASGDHFVLHFRLTKKCNADCSYCSSYEETHDKLTTIENLTAGVSYIKELILKYNLGGGRKKISVQYLGGEILTLPISFVKQIVEKTKDILSPIFSDYQHTVQTNLIGSKEKCLELYNIFGGQLGTSIDNFSNARTINGDSKEYKIILNKNLMFFRDKTGISIPGVIVVSKDNLDKIQSELQLAEKEQRAIVFRPVFLGGKQKEYIDVAMFKEIFLNTYKNWILNSTIIVEPFFSILKKRAMTKINGDISSISGCPFQHNCAQTSINLDPNGDIYVCQDLAENKDLLLGNAYKKVFNEKMFLDIKKRSYSLDSSCYECEFFKECQGGCLKESIDAGLGIYGKTNFCVVWKSLFYETDKMLSAHGREKIIFWLRKLEVLHGIHN